MYAAFKLHKIHFLFFLLVFLSLIVFVCGFSVPRTPWTDPIYQNIQEQATEQLSALFGSKVKIESVGGATRAAAESPTASGFRIQQSQSITSAQGVTIPSVAIAVHASPYQSARGQAHSMTLPR